MDFIRNTIDQKIRLYEGLDNISEVQIYYRVKIEYLLILILAFLWDKNFEGLDPTSKISIMSMISKPTIGQLIDIIRKLDVHKEVLKNKSIAGKIGSYPQIRNEKIGHGFTFQDGMDDFIDQLKELIKEILSSKIFIVDEDFDLILVKNKDGNNFKGINFKSSGEGFLQIS